MLGLAEQYSFVHVNGLRNKWSPGWDAYFLVKTLDRLQIRFSTSKIAYRQVVYLSDKYVAPRSKYHLFGNRVLFDYFHGDPNISPGFEDLLEQLTKRRAKFSGIRVSHSGIESLLLNEGFEGKVFRIPLGVELDWFKMQTECSRKTVRKELRIPQSAVVIGSFQKDGDGWSEGLTPKLIKGPDIFLQTIGCLKSQIPELFVLLTGPARGYVMNGLNKLGVPYRHCFLKEYSELPKLYHALDVYIVSSREEGGPKAVLEAMASGIPLVTTRVGQAIDLVQHDFNGWVTNVEDVEALAYWTQYVVQNSDTVKRVVIRARNTAEENSNDAQGPMWKNFLGRFIECP